MILWIISNIATILISLVLIGIVAAIIVSVRKDRKRGKASCCHCPMAGKCHGAK